MSNKPTFIAYTVKETSKDESLWLRIGAAWEHKDGKGFNIKLEALPINGEIALRAPKAKDGNDS